MAQRSTLCDRIIAPSFVHKSTQRSADRPEDKGGRRAAVVDPVGNSAMLFSFQRGFGGEFAVLPRYFLQKILHYPFGKCCVIFVCEHCIYLQPSVLISSHLGDKIGTDIHQKMT